MAILVAVAGAALGSAFGNASLGWVIGSVLGNLLFPPKGINQEGPRLGDLTVSSSAYGTPIAIGFGTVRTAGNIIWSSGIKETKHVKKTKGGKGGGPSTKTTTYTYAASFALALAEGTADRILRVWADGKIIYNVRGDGSSPTTPDAPTFANLVKVVEFTNTSKKGLKFRFYKGTEDQLPDPLIQADKGEALTPAHRGLVYIVFDNLELADYGNRIPNITVEISFKPPAVATRAFIQGDPYTVAEGGLTDAFALYQFAIDFQRGYLYTTSNDNPSGDSSLGTLRRFNLDTLVEDRQVNTETADWVLPGETSLDVAVQTSQSTLLVSGDGSLIVIPSRSPISGSPSVVARIDPNTYRRVAAFVCPPNFVLPERMTTVRAGSVDFVVMTSQYVISAGVQDVGLVVVRASDMTLAYDSVVATGGLISPGSGGSFPLSLVRGEVRANNADVWQIYWYQDGVAGPDRLRVIKWTIGQSGGVTHNIEYDELISDILPGADFIFGKTTGGAGVYDQVDGGLIFYVDKNAGADGNFVKLVNGSIVWTSPTLSITAVPNTVLNAGGNEFAESVIRNGTMGFISDARPYLLDTATGQWIEQGEAPDYAANAAGSYPYSVRGIYDSRTESYFGFENVNGGIPSRWFFRRSGTQDANVADIVEDICGRVGLDPSQLDTTDLLGDLIPGYIIGSRSSARSMIEPLAGAFFFDATESDFILKFVQRGNASVRTISQDELAVVDSSTQEILRESRQQEVELPERLSVVYMDRDKDYQQGTQSAKRMQNPVPAMFSKNEMSMPLPMVLSAEFSKQLAEKTLYSAWTERVSYQIALSWEHLDLDPTDVITITLDEGQVFTSRLTNVEMGDNLALSLTGVSERAAQYVSTVSADGGTGPLSSVVNTGIVTKLLLLDTTLLRDSDEPAGRAYDPMYFFMGAYTAGWRQGDLYKSADSTTGLDVGQAVSAMTWGGCSALGDPPGNNPYITDTVNTMRVYPYGGDVLESITELEMLNGGNAALLLKTNSEVEIIQYQNATQNSDGSFTLDTFLRGRRGTEEMTNGHTAGDVFVVLDPDDAELFPLALGEVGQSRFYRAVGLGEFIEEAEVITNISQGRALKPYSPVHYAAELVVGDDIDISWVRRTRVGGQMMDLTGTVPLNEDTEEYEVEILDMPGGAVVRTISGITGPTVTYTSAQQTTDGFTPPMVSLSLKVYQMSAQVGRGFTREGTIDVN